METLKTATGMELRCDYFNPFPPLGQVFIRVLDMSLVEVATIFSNPTETVQLYCGDDYVANHTKVIHIAPEGNAIRLTLGKE